MKISVGSCFNDAARGNGLVIAVIAPVGAFTVLNQLMLPRSQYISTRVTFGLPDRRSQAMEGLYENNSSKQVAVFVTRLYPRPKRTRFYARFDKNL